MNYVIIKLSESETTQRAFTYYVITEGDGGLGVSKRLMHNYRGGGGELAL